MKLLNFLTVCGLDLQKVFRSARGLSLFTRDYLRFKRQPNSAWPVRIRPYLSDFFESSGKLTKHYFQQDIHVAREIFHRRPVQHIDVGSRIDGFVAHLAAFMKVEVLDLRANDVIDQNIVFRQADVCKLPGDLVEAYSSVSCLHTIEHVGLGRYGDTVSIDGWKEAVSGVFSLARPKGLVYLSTPVGSKRIEFNAQRVFDLGELCEYLSKFGTIQKLDLINDADSLLVNCPCVGETFQMSKSWKFGCAILTIEKAAKLEE